MDFCHAAELGYVAAPMAFSSDTEEVVLTVNGIRKVTLKIESGITLEPISYLI